MHPAIAPRAVALSTLATLTAATLAAAAPPLRQADARALAQPPAPATRPYVRPADRWLGETRAVAVEGERAYYSVGRAVAVADIGDPAGPRLIGRSAALAIASDDAHARPIEELAASDGTVWTITPDTVPLISAWDVSEPTAVRLVATMHLGDFDWPVAIAARGRDAMVSFNDKWPDRGLTALRRTARGIEVVGRWQLEDPAVSVGDVVWRSRDEVLVALGGGGIGRVAVADGAGGSLRMSLIGQRTDPQSAEGARHLAVDGCRAYTSEADGSEWTGGGFWVFDVCGDRPPALLAVHYFSSLERFDPAGLAARTVSGRPFVIVADSSGGLRAIDATFPGASEWPETEINPPITGEPVCHSDIAVTPDRLVVAGCGLRVLGVVPDAVLPVKDGAILGAPSFGELWSGGSLSLSVMAATGDSVLIAHGNVLSIVDPSGPLGPEVTGRVGYLSVGDPTFDVSDLVVAGHTAWVAPMLSTAVAIDLTDPAAPRVSGELDGSVASVIAVTDRLVAGAINGRVHLFDVSDPSQPRHLSDLALDVPDFGDLAFVGDRLVASAGIAGLHVVDVRDPSHPVVIGRNDVVGTSTMAIADGYAVALAGDRLAIFKLDAIDDGRVRLEAIVPLPDGGPWPNFEAVGVGHVAGRRLAVVKRGPTLVAVDIAEPSQPVVGQPYRLSARADAMAVSGDHAFLFGPRVGAEFSVFELGTLHVAATLALPFLNNLDG